MFQLSVMQLSLGGFACALLGFAIGFMVGGLVGIHSVFKKKREDEKIL